MLVVCSLYFWCYGFRVRLMLLICKGKNVASVKVWRAHGNGYTLFIISSNNITWSEIHKRMWSERILVRNESWKENCRFPNVKMWSGSCSCVDIILQQFVNDTINTFVVVASSQLERIGWKATYICLKQPLDILVVLLS